MKHTIINLRRVLGRRLLFGIIAVLAVIFVFPIFWLLLSSLKIETELVRWPIRWFPLIPQWENYVKVLTDPHYGFLQATFNSLYLAVIHTVPTVLVSAMGGYALARINAPGRKLFMAILLGTMMIPWSVTIIPQFVLYSKIGLVNNPMLWFLWGMGGSAFQIILFRQFFSTFPKELEDAAAIDGANPLTTFVLIFLPNARAVLAVTTLFAFSGVWGDWFGQALFLTSKYTTLAMLLASAFKTPMGRPIISLTFVGITLYAVPLVVIYLLMQREIVQGIVTTGLKG
jgi:ABC-type glycerol-3-phosphate transport system permease component